MTDVDDGVDDGVDEWVDDDTAAFRVGAKVIEAAERLKDVDAAIPGAQATWHFEIEDVRYRVVVTRVGPDEG